MLDVDEWIYQFNVKNSHMRFLFFSAFQAELNVSFSLSM